MLNRERKKKRRRINETIGKKEWKEYYMRLLGGVERRVIRGGFREGRRKEGAEGELGKEEIKRTMKRLKDGKAVGIDEVPNKVWKYGGRGEDWRNGYRSLQ